jgi:hypothetical protein
MPPSPSLPSWALVALAVLALLGVARGIVLVRHDPLLAMANNYDARALAFAGAAGMAAVCLAALFGDGDVEYAKHVHLAANYALASLLVPIALAFRRALAGRGE